MLITSSSNFLADIVLFISTYIQLYSFKDFKSEFCRENDVNSKENMSHRLQNYLRHSSKNLYWISQSWFFNCSVYCNEIEFKCAIIFCDFVVCECPQLASSSTVEVRELRPGFKFSAKIEMVFSQILASSS